MSSSDEPPDWTSACESMAREHALALLAHSRDYGGDTTAKMLQRYMDVFRVTYEGCVSREHSTSMPPKLAINGTTTLSRTSTRRFPSLKDIRHSLMSRSSGGRGDDATARLLLSSPKATLTRGKGKKCKTSVDMVRDDTCMYIGGRELDGQPWRKCRLTLVNTSAGHMLEFYTRSLCTARAPTPCVAPKSATATTGVFCALIEEARATSDVETPRGRQYTWTVRASNGVAYVMEDRVQWLDAIQSTMGDEGDTTPLNDGVPSTSAGIVLRDASKRYANQANRLSHIPNNAVTDAAAECHLRRSHSVGRNARFGTNAANAMTQSMSSRSLQQGGVLQQTEEELYAYPWFHGWLARADAASLVCQTGRDGHGLFLVRHSETRRHEFVLTFNCASRAKHVRLTVDTLGQCHVQRLSFATMFDMLEYFREHPIPLDHSLDESSSSARARVVLQDYVIAWPQHQPQRRHNGMIDARDFMTHSGSVRMRTASLERLANQQAHPLWATVPHENAYHFV